jgi:hypothetical protein
MLYADSDLDFKLTHPGYRIQRVKKAPDPGSATLTKTEYAVRLQNDVYEKKINMIKSNNLQ